MTPEGKVKKAVRDVCKSFSPECYLFMPVQNGMGSPALDFIGIYRGRGFSVETKAGSKGMTPRQEQTAKALRAAGATVFLVNETEGLEELKGWLECVKYAMSPEAYRY